MNRALYITAGPLLRDMDEVEEWRWYRSALPWMLAVMVISGSLGLYLLGDMLNWPGRAAAPVQASATVSDLNCQSQKHFFSDACSAAGEVRP